MIIRNANILTEKVGLLHGDLKIENGRIAAIHSDLHADGEETFDARGCILIPGLVDIHNHGFFGTEFAAADEEFDKGTEELAKRGITTVVPTLRCLPKERLLAAIRNVKKEMVRKPAGAKLGGINMEGPFISPNKTGSMLKENLSEPSRADLEGYLAECEGTLKSMTLAPELPGVVDFIEDILFAGANASIGHTCATFEEAKAAADAGANLATHLYNAMSPFTHRAPGVVGEALLDERLSCELICDFIHNTPAAIALAIKNKGYDKIAMISDTGRISGLGDGEYVIEGKKRIVIGKTCKTENGTIAGSVCDLFYDFKNLVEAGYPLAEVSHMASRNPARLIGLGHDRGTIEIGKAADLVLLSPSCDVAAVWVDGKRV